VASVAKIKPALAMIPVMKKMTDKQLSREHAKHAMRRATEDWVEGRMSTKEHSAVHARAKHLLSGKHPSEFKGRTGERKIRGM
jgi:hypothetical protein